MNSYVIVLGGGSGRRMDAGVNKVFLPLRDVPAIIRSIAPFSAICTGAIVVAAADELEQMQTMIGRYGLSKFVKAVVSGGKERQDSVANGLAALPGDAEAVLVHDGARPLVTVDVIKRVLSSIQARGCGIAAVSVVDTIKRAKRTGEVIQTPQRDELYAMQTPQGFRADLIRSAHLKACEEGYIATDDAALLEYAGMPVFLCEGDRENIKLTTAIDIALAEAILIARMEREIIE
ncbi:MAG: 2-C-methyl-D-erythritol 4-phosphate cytidylyltransferase [Clostridiales bacterium]|nr:2-C-methyl-D-erythritol 4-phosphate cytidylyltransferase [Clostridiales bacterium]